ncbi:glutathione-disulfide reductase [Aerococcaceae bacterium zg-ZJ1578]|uniref:glutathione-disulfide reductase n=1 Tax=Aerococcaceae bacterium zg-252 TaxID=2796928 RepID=UPI001A1C23DD|nr:glutathione-disulfide reductase [Aerococcaceae bacterium zg-1578]
MREYDLITIGGGSGGIATANRAAQYGAKVAVIEANLIGGTCVNVGCVPKKVSWYAAKINEAIHHYGPGYGFTVEKAQFDFQQFLAARNGYVERSRNSYDNAFTNNGVEVIDGYATFVNQNEVEVNGERIRAKHIVIATGGRPSMPDVKGIELTDNSDDFFEWQALPESVLVVGAGYIAVELAGVLHSLGVDTKLAVRYERPLRTFDRMLTDGLVEAMEKNGPTLLTNTTIDEYRKNGDKIECLMQGKVVATVDKVVVAIGRKPNVEHLKLENAGVALDERGYIQVDEQHQTSTPGIYAIGDVIGKVDLTPVAIKAGRQISEYLFNQASTAGISYELIPTVVFSHPPIGTIGLTEEEALKQFGEADIKIYRSKFFSMYASASGHREPCYFKLVCQGPDEVVVGLHGIGEGVDEMIQGFGVAMKMKATKADFDAVVAIHPTGSEEFVTMR